MFSFCTILALFANLLVGTWNLRWFPGGEAPSNPLVAPAVRQQKEAHRMVHAAAIVQSGLRGRCANEHAVLFFQEIRDEAACTNLLAQIGEATGLRLACVSKFEVAKGRVGLQQDCILTDLPILDAGWSRWRWPRKTKNKGRRLLPPRGYAFAFLDGGAEGVIACYCVHLKGNSGVTTAVEAAFNRTKREQAAEQLVELTKKTRLHNGRRVTRIVIAGDFNTDVFDAAFAGERTIPVLTAAGYLNGLASASPDQRVTYPQFSERTGSTLDYIFHRGFLAQTERWLSAVNEVSDHRMVWLRLE